MEDWLKLAQQGDAEAIAYLLSPALTPNGITLAAIAREHHLRLILESAQGPSPGWGRALQQSLMALKIPAIHQVTVIGKQTGEVTPHWSQTFNLAPSGHFPESE